MNQNTPLNNTDEDRVTLLMKIDCKVENFNGQIQLVNIFQVVQAGGDKENKSKLISGFGKNPQLSGIGQN